MKTCHRINQNLMFNKLFNKLFSDFTGVNLNYAYVATTGSMPNGSWPTHYMVKCGQFGIIPPGYWDRVICDRESSKVIVYMLNRNPICGCEVHINTITENYINSSKVLYITCCALF